MLTKQEREEIAERTKLYTEEGRLNAYLYLFGREIPNDTSMVEDYAEVSARILDLCDTSNMLELPRDKDGEIIRPGDTVYDSANEKYEVAGYMLYDDSKSVILKNGTGTGYIRPANNLTHKQPVTVKSLAQRIKHVLEDEATSIGVNPYAELGRIAHELESLGDSNE